MKANHEFTFEIEFKIIKGFRKVLKSEWSLLKAAILFLYTLACLCVSDMRMNSPFVFGVDDDVESMEVDTAAATAAAATAADAFPFVKPLLLIGDSSPDDDKDCGCSLGDGGELEGVAVCFACIYIGFICAFRFNDTVMVVCINIVF